MSSSPPHESPKSTCLSAQAGSAPRGLFFSLNRKQRKLAVERSFYSHCGFWLNGRSDKHEDEKQRKSCSGRTFHNQRVFLFDIKMPNMILGFLLTVHGNMYYTRDSSTSSPCLESPNRHVASIHRILPEQYACFACKLQELLLS